MESTHNPLDQNATTVPFSLASIEFDTQFRIIRWSKEAEKIFGWSAAEVLGCAIREMYWVHEEDWPLVQRQMTELANGTTPRAHCQNRNYRKDGSSIYCSWFNSAFYNETGELIAVRSNVLDITAQKTLEMHFQKATEHIGFLEKRLRKAQQMEALGLMARSMASDFCALVDNIRGNLLVLADDPFPDSKRAAISNSIETTQKVNQMVNQLLTFSRQTQDNVSPIDIKDVAAKALKILRASVPDTIEIEESFADGKWLVDADPSQIHQVIINLCTNALHAMEKDGGALWVCIDETEQLPTALRDEIPFEHTQFVHLSVSDTGCGISPENMNKIFHPFFTTRHSEQAGGMGLPIIYGIVKEIGGGLHVESAPGLGTTVHIFFPRSAARDSDNPNPCTGKHVLFVDDEPMLCALAEGILKPLGCKITTKTRSFEALEAFRNQPELFDVIVTDQTMPGMTGIEMTAHIKQVRPDIPVVLCTGFSNQVDEARAKKQGAFALVLKPFSRDTIRKVVCDALTGFDDRAYQQGSQPIAPE